MSYLLDADFSIQALAGRLRATTAINMLASSGISISLITVGEIYEGAFGSPNPQAHLDTFRRFLSPYRILNLNEPIMERFAETRAYLRRRGEIISDADIIIGATALHYDLTILTFNLRHLRRIPDVRVYQP